MAPTAAAQTYQWGCEGGTRGECGARGQGHRAGLGPVPLLAASHTLAWRPDASERGL